MRLPLLALAAMTATLVASQALAFNPQPDPPGRARHPVAAFNPQPDPPGRAGHVLVRQLPICRGHIHTHCAPPRNVHTGR
jgi:hypothetical protein